MTVQRKHFLLFPAYCIWLFRSEQTLRHSLPNYPHFLLPHQSQLSFKYVRVISIRAVENENQRVSCLISYWGSFHPKLQPCSNTHPNLSFAPFPSSSLSSSSLPYTLFKPQPTRSLICMFNNIVWLNQVEFQHASCTRSQLFPSDRKGVGAVGADQGLNSQCKGKTEENSLVVLKKNMRLN